MTTHSDHSQPVFNNLLNRQFDVDQPNRVYASDVTYLAPGRLAILVRGAESVFKKSGWLKHEFPHEGATGVQCFDDGDLAAPPGSRLDSSFGSWHSIGEQSISTLTEDSRLPRQHEPERGLLRSVNAVVESFFGNLKQESVQWGNYQTRYEVQQYILNYITMFYHSHRLHSYLGYKSPNQYEAEMSQLQKVA